MTQAVSRWLPAAAEALVPSQCSLLGSVEDELSHRQVFLLVLRFSSVSIVPTVLRTHQST